MDYYDAKNRKHYIFIFAGCVFFCKPGSSVIRTPRKEVKSSFIIISYIARTACWAVNKTRVSMHGL